MNKPKVRLLSYTPHPDRLVFIAARVCYSNKSIEEVIREAEKESDFSLIRKVVERGHHSVLEHASFTFGIEGISRVCSHQLVRHRIASYSQQSQRYVSYEDGVNFIMPESVRDSELSKEVNLFVQESQELYKKLVSSGIPKEDARFILPSGVETKIVVTMNARELHHFFSLRLCERAQWEIRKLALEMLREVRKVAPTIFEWAGPPCVRGSCPEGKNGCGKIEEVRKFYREFWKKDASR